MALTVRVTVSMSSEDVPAMADMLLPAMRNALSPSPATNTRQALRVGLAATLDMIRSLLSRDVWRTKEGEQTANT